LKYHWYWDIRILRWDILRSHTSQDSHVGGEKTIRDSRQNRGADHKLRSAVPSRLVKLLRRAIRYQRGEPFVVEC